MIDYDGSGSNVPLAPIGWSAIRHDSAYNGDRISSWLYYRIAGLSEPAAYTWNINAQWAAGAMAAWRGVMASPIDNATGSTVVGNSPLSATPPWSSPTYGNELRICIYASQGFYAPNISPPAALTQRLNANSSKEGFTLAFGDVAASAGTSSSYAAAENGGGVLAAQSILLIPAQASGPTPTVSPTPIPTALPPTPVATPSGPTSTALATPTAMPGGSASPIEFIAASPLSDYGSPVSSVSIGLPAGVQTSDCLLAQIIVYDPNGSNVPSPPAGGHLSVTTP